jgi:hypothetical protein
LFRRIGEQQAAAANAQAEIARDRLRFDQFDKRYEVFEAVRRLIRTVVNDSAKLEFRAMDLAPLYARLNEAPLFFSQETCDLIESIRTDCEKFVAMNSIGAPPPPPIETPEKWVLATKLVAALNNLPQRFVPELGLTQPEAKLPPFPT